MSSEKNFFIKIASIISLATILLEIIFFYRNTKKYIKTPEKLYPSHSEYISFVNTYVTPRNIDLRNLVSMSVCPSVHSKHDCVRTQRATCLKLLLKTYISNRPVGIEKGYIELSSFGEHVTPIGRVPG